MSEVIRISEQGKRQLIALKRSTKVNQWNILCRWALCCSLAEDAVLRETDLGPMSNVEITWTTLCGNFQQCITALLKHRFLNEPDELRMYKNVNDLCTAHIHRGVMILSHQKLSIYRLVQTAPRPL